MTDKKFNSWFSSFILAGILISVAIITYIKFDASDPRAWLLIISAFGSFAGVLSTILSANARILTFVFGLIDVTLYGSMCLVNWYGGQSGLGNAILHFVYFVPMQFIGLWQWRKRSTGDGRVAARRLKPAHRWGSLFLFIVGCLISYFILLKFDRSGDASFLRLAVILDVLPLMFNILGQMLMSMAYMEQWFFWIGVNVTSILMWSFAGDSGYAPIYIAKYSFYLLNSLNGLRIWMILSRDENR